MTQPTDKAPLYQQLLPGDPAPRFIQRTGANPRFVFDSAAGRHLVLCFFASAADPRSRAAIDAVLARRAIFDDQKLSFFGISLDPADERESRVHDAVPGIRFFWDFDATASRLYGSTPVEAAPRSRIAARRFWAVIDPMLRVSAVFPFTADGSEIPALFAYLDALPPPGRLAGIETYAPVIFLPNVFEPDLCRRLIAAYEAHGGEESGFMREVNGKTVLVQDHSHKRRRDYIMEDEALMAETRGRILRRIVPEILKVHQFKATRMERYIVACYAAEDGGHFNAHRDNTTKGTAHRRFAVSINLNDDFDGGELSFPEYGPQSYKPPPGGAVIFSCSLLHRAGEVTRGLRYAFLPFLYDDEAARLREANARFLDLSGAPPPSAAPDPA